MPVYVDDNSKTYDDYKADIISMMADEEEPELPQAPSANSKAAFKYVFGVLVKYILGIVQHNQEAPVLGTVVQLKQDWRYLIFSALGIPGWAKLLEQIEDLLWYSANGFRCEYQFDLWEDPEEATYGYECFEYNIVDWIIDMWNTLVTQWKRYNITIATVSGVLLTGNLIDAEVQHRVIKRYKWRLPGGDWSDWIDLEGFFGEDQENEGGTYKGFGFIWLKKGETSIFRSIGFGFVENFIRHGKFLEDLEFVFPGTERWWYDTGEEDELGNPIYKVGTDSWWLTHGFPWQRKYRLIRDVFCKDLPFLILLGLILYLMKKWDIGETYHRHIMRASRRKIKQAEARTEDIYDKVKSNHKKLEKLFSNIETRLDAKELDKSYGIFKQMFTKLEARGLNTAYGIYRTIYERLKLPRRW